MTEPVERRLGPFVSFGGGVQSTALLVLAARNEIPHRTFLFANVGDDSEHPATIDYLHTIHRPFAEAHGLELHELHRRDRKGERFDTLLEYTLTRKRTIPIPVRMANGAPGNRTCTFDWKIKVIERWLRDAGHSAGNPADVAIGFSTDELHRIGRGKGSDLQRLHYPLVDLGMSRADCLTVVKDAGLPPPPRSSCWFCPYHTRTEWRRLKELTPELFDKAVELERKLNDRRATLGRDSITFHSSGLPLDRAVDDQLAFDLGDGPEIDTCDEGGCFT